MSARRRLLQTKRLPREVDQALRTRISEFYQDHGGGKFRQKPWTWRLALAAVGRGDFAAPVEPQPPATITPARVPRLSPYRHFGGSGVIRGNLC